MPTDDIIISIADWQNDRDRLSQIRRTIFIEEQNVPEELEWDDDDETATHFLVTRNDEVIATARLKPDGQIGRMAVIEMYRNKGIGSQLLHFVIQTATRLKLKQVYLHAQTSAIHFYEKQGFITNTEIFYEANIPHRGMLLNIC